MEELETTFDFGDDLIQEEQVTEEPSIFDGVEEQEPSTEEVEEQVETEEVQYDEEGNVIEPEPETYIDKLLKAKGIDKTSIEITDEDGTVSTVSFEDLSDEDKVALLSEEAPVDSAITETDLDILNYFHANRINSLQDFADGIAKQAVNQYIASQQDAPKSDIDAYSDDEILAYDLIQKFGDEMTDEEIDAEIARLKEDETAYGKRVNLLRTYYKNEEEAQRKLYEEEQATQQNANTKAFIDAYQSAASNLGTIQGIDLDDDDRQAVLDYAINKDAFGRTELAKALDDPDQVLKMCWFLKYGESAFEATRQYYAQQISKARAQAAKPTEKPKPRAVSRPTGTAATPRTKETSAFRF